MTAGNGKISDGIDRAIAAAAPTTVPVVQISIRLATGRPVVLAVPSDITADEAVEMIGYICTRLPGKILETIKGQQPMLVRATGPLPPPPRA